MTFLGFIVSLHKLIHVCLKKEREEDGKGAKKEGIDRGRKKEQNEMRKSISTREITWHLGLYTGSHIYTLFSIMELYHTHRFVISYFHLTHHSSTGSSDSNISNSSSPHWAPTMCKTPPRTQ